MGLLSKLFHKGPSRDKWGSIAARIAVNLEEVRQAWFVRCVEVFESVGREVPLGPQIVNRTLGGEADLAIKAYQLVLASSCLGKHSYIPRSQGAEFGDLLCLAVCGTDTHKVAGYFRQYVEVEGATQLFRFFSDVARYITGTGDPFAATALGAETLKSLAILTNMAIAEAFGDEATVRDLGSKLT